MFKGRADHFLLHSHTEERMFRKKLCKKALYDFHRFFHHIHGSDHIPFFYAGHSIYGTTFADENFKLKHLGAGWVSKHMSVSPFFGITLSAKEYVECVECFLDFALTFWMISSLTKYLCIKADKIGDDTVHEMENRVCVFIPGEYGERWS